MITVTPDERLGRIARARSKFDRARSELMQEIGEAFTDAEALPDDKKRLLGPSAIGRAAHFTREYISQLRDSRQR